ncbi:MAG: helix-hairpin-helix domain-containing protein [Nanoarchaeota archaeon]|nr:helix-hairpin-helix domain-containing protein [Nanoarchaeota archaeon]
MAKIFFLFLFFILLIPVVFPTCNEGQIDINSASLEELDQIIMVGPSTAEKIVLMRPFLSVDDLIDVSGIGNKTLEKIKSQGLACVSSEISGNANQSNITENESPSQAHPITMNNSENRYSPLTPKITEAIVLNQDNSKDIETGANPLSSDRIALYGLIAFGLFIGGLLAAKRLKSYKTEFINEK